MLRLREVFGPAFDAARRALRDLDADQVPADLRRVTAHAGDLPPPLEVALIRGIDRYEWLRSAALEAWPEAQTDASGAEGSSALLLRRPHGWMARVVQHVAQVAEAGASEAVDRARERAGLMEEQLVEAQRRHKSAAARVDELEGRLEGRRQAERAERRAERKPAEQLEAAVAREREAWSEEVSGLRRDLEAHAEVEARLQEELRRVKKERGRLARKLAEATGGASWPADDPVGLARKIDEMARMAVPPATGGDDLVVPLAGDPEMPSMPAGVRPDTPEAVSWMAGLPLPVTVLVDGYNVGHALAEDPASMRAAVELRLREFAQESRQSHRVVVVYDSAEGGGRSLSTGSLDVRFTSAGVIADDVIVELAGQIQGPIAVITSDRELRERTEALGALTLWAEALREWQPSR